MNPTILIISAGVAVAIVAIAVLCKLFYRVADANQVLVITGGKEPVIKPSGGSFVIPIFRKAQYFPLNMRTITSDKDEIKTSTSVPIFIDWTAQIRPQKTKDPQNPDVDYLSRAVTSFLSMSEAEINENIKQTLTGTVRDIVSSMTPENVLKNKEEFKKNVEETAKDEMQKMGMELVSLNIQDISDPNDYFNNIAAIDMADKRKAAQNKTAIIEQEIREQQAVSEKIAKERELETQLSVAEKERDNALRVAEFKTETDKANADAEIAGELQATVRRQEMAVEEGKVEVVRQEQANLAAIKAKEVEMTKAETRKAQAKIDADAEAEVKSIKAEADVLVAEKQAKAVKIEADANAEKVMKEGQAKTEVIKLEGTANAEATKAKLLAEAEAEKAKLLAQAEGEKAKLLAEAEGVKAKLLAEAEGEGEKLKQQAEGEMKLAEARAANDKVNLEIEKAKIFAGMQIEIATKTATVMANIGQNAEFVNIGNSNANGGSGNVLLDTLKQVPSLMKSLNAENEALNGQSINDEIKALGEALLGPAKGIFSYNGVAPSETSPEIVVDSTPTDTSVEE